MDHIEGTYEYCGIQRTGKSTVMVADLVNKLLPLYRPEDVLANFRIFIPGIQTFSTADLISKVFDLKCTKQRHKVIMFDECGQSLTARGWKSRDQTDFVNFAWQMPKRDIVLLYATNIGNSADVILRDATWVTILPHYIPESTRHHIGPYIVSDVIYNYDCRTVQGVILPNVRKYQRLFDSYEAIE